MNHKNPTKRNPVYSDAIGDRLSTFMAYLSDVEVGGATVFPRLGIASQATQGKVIVSLSKYCTLMCLGHFHSSLLFEMKFSYFCVDVNYFCKIQVNFVNFTLPNCQKN